jgi:tRNA threonylcarbamoyladenosine biosynthesis protein TsaB
MPHCYKDSTVLLLAFDTATDRATSALVADGTVLGERVSRSVTLLADIDALMRDARVEPAALDGIVVGTGPGSFTGTRIGLSVARGLALAPDIPVAGVSTLAALAIDGATPVVDARRHEVFVPGPRALRPEELVLEPGTRCVGDGAVRYRDVLAAAGAVIPEDEADAHVPFARHHARLAERFGPVDAVEPIYVRAPDADRILA